MEPDHEFIEGRWYWGCRGGRIFRLFPILEHIFLVLIFFVNFELLDLEILVFGLGEQLVAFNEQSPHGVGGVGDEGVNYWWMHVVLGHDFEVFGFELLFFMKIGLNFFSLNVFLL